MTKMIVEFFFVFDLAGALLMDFHFDFLAFVALAFELRIVNFFALLLLMPSNLSIVVSSSALQGFVASFGI